MSGSDVGAILDDDGGGVLADSTAGVPGHLGAGAGQAGDRQRGHDLDQGVADLLVAHVSGDTGGLDGLIQGVDGVIGVGTELVGDLAVGFLILGDKILGQLVLSVSGEGEIGRASCRERV